MQRERDTTQAAKPVKNKSRATVNKQQTAGGRFNIIFWFFNATLKFWPVQTVNQKHVSEWTNTLLQLL